MDDSWQAEEETDVPAAGLGYREELWVDDVCISPSHCPDCLKHEDFKCYLCDFFVPETCPMLYDPFLMQDVRTILDIWRERRAVQRRRKRALIRAVRSELQAHGRPLHYAVLARIVANRHPKLEVSEQGVLKIMASHPEKFEKVAEGVYRCQRTNQY